MGSTLASLAPEEAKFWPSLWSTTWVVNGVAEGEAVGLTVLGVELTAATSPGQSAIQLAHAIADAIRAEPRWCPDHGDRQLHRHHRARG